MRWLGGVPWTAGSSSNLVYIGPRLQTADGRVQLMSSPGHARPILGWKTGFYYIALGAGVPNHHSLTWTTPKTRWPAPHSHQRRRATGHETVKAFYAPVRADTPGTLAPDDVDLRVVGGSPRLAAQ
jgi:hypothetical protein